MNEIGEIWSTQLSPSRGMYIYNNANISLKLEGYLNLSGYKQVRRYLSENKSKEDIEP